jgi:hypothetical protein
MLDPEPLSTRALPVAVWEDHLLPQLTCKDAARLGCSCKALRGLVREHFRDVGTVKMKQLRGALTTFQRARTVHLRVPEGRPGHVDVGALVRWLRKGGRGRYLERMTLGYSENGEDLVHQALQAGALPSLKHISADLQYPSHRASLTEGLVADMHELQLTIDCTDEDAELELQLASLGLVRQLPALVKLEVSVCADSEFHEPVQWPAFIPPFIPPFLKELRLNIQIWPDGLHVTESLFCALQGMLEASGARLDRLQVHIPPDLFEELGSGLVHLAQALRCCSPTLAALYIGTSSYHSEPAQEDADRLERLRVQWADVLAGVSVFRELQVLVLPHILLEPLFPPGTAFDRLTHLEIADRGRQHPPDAGMMGLWELMASGGLPALAKLDVMFEGRWGGSEHVRSRVAPGLEAVAGTLKRLQLETASLGRLNVKVDVGYELGVAVGKLRRLKDLALNLSKGCSVYHAFAQGLAASGGERPLPLLWRVGVISAVYANADLLVSLLLPSVRVFASRHGDAIGALVTACALRQAGYKHVWAMWWVGGDESYPERIALGAVSPCSIVDHGYPEPRWVLRNREGLPWDEALQ